MQTTDVHGNFYPHNFITQQPAKGSLARVSTAANEARVNGGIPVILLDNGDILQGQPTAYYYNYVDTIAPHLSAQMLNFIGYDAVSVGNHDMETGRKVLERYASDCAMPVLGANIIDTRTGQPAFQPYKVFNRDGIKIAVLGMLTPAIPAWLPESLWQGLRFDDMEETARKWIPIIQERENPDAIIGLFHAGQAGNILSGYKENASLEVAKNVPGFDIVMMGHDHRRENKWIVNNDGDSVLIINPANNAVAISDVVITFDINEQNNVIEKKIDGKLLEMSAFEPDSAFMKRFAIQYDTVSNYVSRPLGTMSSPISTRPAFFGPSEFVDLIHSLQLAITGAEISMAAPLSYDATIPAGTITMGDMFNLYKYENLLYVMELTGAEIKNYLEESYGKWVNTMTSADDHMLLFKETVQKGDESRSALKNPSYNFDSAAGIIYEVDVTKPKGEKVTIKSMADGKPFDMKRKYKVALNSYRGNGGGELLTKGAGIAHEDLKNRIIFSTDRDFRYYLAEYIEQQGRLNPVSLNQWRFIPEEWVKKASARDRQLLFPR
ncbi:MAG: 5'-nucleotidase C-terminal domain-containing protein [Muribaculum sp.]|nr:5'-nucleotidase C-terminal domain-containing protein [Muribaculaceae bacterium]MCM1080632.1 5'-nucleotidase C-terminal domain-containing protein [Muribaculum sp.]